MRAAVWLLVVGVTFAIAPDAEARRKKKRKPAAAVGTQTKRTDPWLLEPSHPHPTAGNRVFLRFGYTNLGPDDVQIPADLLEHVHFEGTACRRPGQCAALAPAPRPTKVQASSITWLNLAPGESVEEVRDLGHIMPRCTNGCRGGDYELSAVSTRSIQGRKANMVEPKRRSERRALRVTPNVVPVASSRDLDLRFGQLQRLADGRLTVAVSITNRGKTPLWVPRGSGFSVTKCVITQRNIMALRTLRSRYRDTPPTYNEGLATLLQPGESTDIEAVGCRMKPEETMVFVDIELRAHVPRPEVTVDPPFFFSGTLRTPKSLSVE